MLPLKLSIEGLYSYQERQEIDFASLTEAGLFGIFGAVGSGKSSILEAISYALYGETERMSNKEKRSYNMLNLRSKTAFISYEFINFEQQKFRFEVKWNRRKNFDSITTPQRTAYKWSEEQWVPLASNAGADVVGLSYVNFRRTVIIPQGKFKEFLELGDSDRSKMMKEIFNLEAYDLQYKTAALQAENNRKIEHLKGALAGFEELSPALIAETREACDQQKIRVEQETAALDSLQKKVQSLRKLQETWQELALNEAAFEQLLQQEADIKSREQKLQKYELAQQHFADLLRRQEQQYQEQQLLNTQLQDTAAQYAVKLSKQESLTASYLALFPQYELIPAQKEYIQDFGNILAMKELIADSNLLKARLEKAAVVLQDKNNQEQALLAEIQKQEAEMDSAQAEKIDTTELMNISQWYQQHSFLVQQQQNIQQKSSLLRGELATIIQQFLHQPLQDTTWKEQLAQTHQILANQLQDAAQQKLALEITREISKHAVKLTAGEPCLLCGSLTHPSPRNEQDVSEDLHQLVLSEVTLKNAELQAQQKGQAYSQYMDELAQLQQQLQAHESTFCWPAFDPKDSRTFEAEKEKSKALEQKLQLLTTQVKTLRGQQQSLQQELKKYEEARQELATKIEAKRALYKNYKQALIKLDFADYKEQDSSTIQQQLEQLNTTIQSVEHQYTSLTDALQLLKPEIAREEALQESYTTQLKQLNKKIISDNSLLETNLIHTGFTSLEAVKEVLALALNATAERAALLDYKLQVERLQGLIHNLKEKVNEQTFDEAEFLQQEALLNNAVEQLKENIGRYSSLQQDLKRLESAFEKQKELLLQLDKLTHRGSHLQTFSGLFRGAAFVNYISTIYLQNLCEAANIRFHRLTKNQLSLRVNVESNDFEVIDYLHNGYARSVKTLSGGQSFQASLCLALALAESVQALNKGQKNFFFIDEGFGTQDNDSINTVFETLQYLHQENRIVGIISHVDELKERIPRAITVLKDEEKGSLLQINN